jgi:hypothetical protein
VESLRRACRLADEQREETGRERIERATVADASDAENAARNGDDVMRGPALGLVDREDAGCQAIPSATGCAARAATRASRAARSTALRTSLALPLMSVPAART